MLITLEMDRTSTANRRPKVGHGASEPGELLGLLVLNILLLVFLEVSAVSIQPTFARLAADTCRVGWDPVAGELWIPIWHHFDHPSGTSPAILRLSSRLPEEITTVSRVVRSGVLLKLVRDLQFLALSV